MKIATGAARGGGAFGSGVLVPRGVELSIVGDGEGVSVLDAKDAARHFLVASGGVLSLSALTLRGGRSMLSGGGAALVLPEGALTASDVTFTGNRALMGSGGAIAARGSSVKLTRVALVSNEATWRGGALSLTSLGGGVDAALETKTADVGASTATLEAVRWEGNRAGRGADDVTISRGAVVSPSPSQLKATVELSGDMLDPPSVDSERGIASGGASGIYGGAGGGRGLHLADASMLTLECASEALDLLDQKGLERAALGLLQQASVSDPYSPNAFNFHFK